MRQPETKRSLFISDLLKGIEAHRLIQFGDKAQSLRDYETVAQVGVLLQAMPGRYSMAGDLYVALATSRAGDDRAQEVMEQLAECGCARASLALGSKKLRQENPDGAIQLYQQAQLGNTLTRFLSVLMTAEALGGRGEHSAAVRLLEGMEGIAFHIGQQFPAYLFAWINALAVELGAVGRYERALKLSAIAAASPYSAVYSEWGETYSELLSTQPRGLWTGYTHEAEIVQPSKTDAVCRIERVLCNPTLTGAQLHRYADAGDATLVA